MRIQQLSVSVSANQIILSVGVTNPSPEVLDFNHWRSLQPIYDAARLAGIFVVLRAGELASLLPPAGIYADASPPRRTLCTVSRYVSNAYEY